MKLKFVVPGDPKGKGRPRVESHGGFSKARTPEDTVLYENLIKTMYIQQCRRAFFEKDIPLDVRIIGYYSIPSGASKKRKAMMATHLLRPMKKPDCDNVAKVVMDSLNKLAYHDDAQVVDFQFRKFFSFRPRLVITIQESAPVQEVPDNE